MKRNVITMEAFTNEILNWQKDETSQKRIAKINEIIEILRATPKFAGTKKVRGLRKYKNIFRYKFYAYGDYCRLFYIYNKLNIAVLYIDTRDEKTYKEEQKRRLERLAIQAETRFLKIEKEAENESK